MLQCFSGTSKPPTLVEVGEARSFPLKPFDMLDDGLVLAILECFERPSQLCAAALVSLRFAQLCSESYLWKPLLHLELPSTSRSWLSWPPCTTATTAWRERYKQWHTLSHLSWSEVLSAPGRAQPCERFLHRAAAVSSELMYVYGGRGDDGELGDLWKMQCDAAVHDGSAVWELVVPLSEQVPIARLSATLSAVTLSGPAHHGLLMFGGRCGDSFLNDVWLFDTRALAWEMLAPHTIMTAAEEAPVDLTRPIGRWAHSAVTHQSTEVVIFGGSAPGRCFNDVFSFDTRKGQWVHHEPMGTPPSERSGHSVCCVGGSMYVFGGNTTKESFNDLWEYAISPHAWTLVKKGVSVTTRAH
jgi:hypothetical protein